jgi:hypothetical protein
VENVDAEGAQKKKEILCKTFFAFRARKRRKNYEQNGNSSRSTLQNGKILASFIGGIFGAIKRRAC